ncbi:protease [Myxococcaceae bacterium GXIMD 01537]
MTRGHITGCVLLWCGAVGAGACAPRKEAPPPPPVEQQAPAPVEQKGAEAVATTLTCALSAPAQMRAGEPVEVRFRLSNPTAKPLSVLKWHTPLEGLLNNIFEVTRDGTDIPYQGPMFKRADPSADSYATVPAGGSVEAPVEVSLGYEMKAPGRYRIAFRGGLMDVISEPSAVPHTRDQFQPLALQCPAVEVTVTAP